MRIINFGSLNIDHVYEVDHFVSPGETISSTRYSRFCGGKGLNQSIALARAGARVTHAGMIGADGALLREFLDDAGVDTHLVQIGDSATGHAVIQVTPQGDNAIVVYGGANHQIGRDLMDQVLNATGPGDWLLLQNEVNCVPEMLTAAHDRGVSIALNPAPMTDAVEQYPLETLHTLFVNEIEGAQLTGCQQPKSIVKALLARHPHLCVVLTLGERGAVFANAESWIEQPSFSVEAIDTTAAGDTFIGYYLAAVTAGAANEAALKIGCLAASVCVTRHGAADSIPSRSDLSA